MKTLFSVISVFEIIKSFDNLIYYMFSYYICVSVYNDGV